MVHSAYWTSMECLDGHHTHASEAGTLLTTLDAPLISLEIAVQRARQP